MPRTNGDQGHGPSFEEGRGPVSALALIARAHERDKIWRENASHALPCKISGGSLLVEPSQRMPAAAGHAEEAWPPKKDWSTGSLSIATYRPDRLRRKRCDLLLRNELI